MKQYIDKDALVAEIESKIKECHKRGEESNALQDSHGMYWWGGALNCLNEIRNLLNTLEVKEVDLEKEIIDWWNTHYSEKDYTFEGHAGHYLENSTIIDIAKYFFELGLKTKGE